MSNDNNNTTAGLSRRAMLARLGLVATAAYSAPVLLKLGEAQAGSSSRSGPSRSGPSFSGSKRSGSKRSDSRRAGAGRSFSGRARRRGSFT